MAHRIPLFFVLFWVLFSVGCSQTPVQVIPPSSTILHRVTSGESVHKIAQDHYLSSEDVIAANDLQAPYNIRAGQKLKMPELRLHTVVKGENLGRIAEDYQVSVSGLAKVNSLKVPYVLSVGQKLRIPSSQYRADVMRATLRKVSHKVAPKRIQVRKSTPDLSKMKVLRAPKPRKKVILVEVIEDEKPVSQPKPVQKKKPRLQKKKTPPKKKDTVQDQSSSEKFIWPLRGKVVSKFGSKSDGVHNDGINISAKVGTPVKATAHGSVVYAGEKLSGFGHILIIRHDKAFMSAYAHNQVLLVKRGDSVRQGEVIARSGKSGNVPNGQLHFEIRQNGKARDPLQYLR